MRAGPDPDSRALVDLECQEQQDQAFARFPQLARKRGQLVNPVLWQTYAYLSAAMVNGFSVLLETDSVHSYKRAKVFDVASHHCLEFLGAHGAGFLVVAVHLLHQLRCL
jgi:hypothetical protein